MKCMTVMSVCHLLEQYPKNELLLQLSAGYSGNAVTLKRESPRHSGKLFNTHSTDKVKPER
jgi:hypothetical protein